MNGADGKKLADPPFCGSGALSTFVFLAIAAQELFEKTKSIGGPRSFPASMQLINSRNDDEHTEGSEEGCALAGALMSARGDSVGDSELIPQGEDQGSYALRASASRQAMCRP
ncbi:hypothetical protein EV715DRAFT_291358 [Schizophyllum commune]